MRDDQLFTVFGGSYVTENHGFSHLPAVERKGNSGARIAVAAGLLMLGITAATATKATRTLDGLWAHSSHSTWAVAAFEDALY